MRGRGGRGGEWRWRDGGRRMGEVGRDGRGEGMRWGRDGETWVEEWRDSH